MYILAIGSNRPLSAHLSPTAILRAAIATLDAQGHCIQAVAPFLDTAPLGPSRRRYVNSAIVVASPLPPPALLQAVHAIEARFGRRRAQRWGTRTLDIDIIAWSGGQWRSRDLIIPHAAFRERDFVLKPLTAVAPHWREPMAGLRPVHLLARHKKSRVLHAASG